MGECVTRLVIRQSGERADALLAELGDRLHLGGLAPNARDEVFLRHSEEGLTGGGWRDVVEGNLDAIDRGWRDLVSIGDRPEQ